MIPYLQLQKSNLLCYEGTLNYLFAVRSNEQSVFHISDVTRLRTCSDSEQESFLHLNKKMHLVSFCIDVHLHINLQHNLLMKELKKKKIKLLLSDVYLHKTKVHSVLNANKIFYNLYNVILPNVSLVCYKQAFPSRRITLCHWSLQSSQSVQFKQKLYCNSYINFSEPVSLRFFLHIWKCFIYLLSNVYVIYKFSCDLIFGNNVKTLQLSYFLLLFVTLPLPIPISEHTI